MTLNGFLGIGRRWALLAVFGICVVGLGAVLSFSEDQRWRAQIVYYRATGQIEGVGWLELPSMLKRGSGVSLETLAETKNFYSSIRNPASTASDVERGRDIYRSRCAACHGDDGSGGTGPALSRGGFKHGDSDWAIFQVIRGGVQGTLMPAHDLPNTDIWQLISFVQSLEDDAPTNGDEPRLIEPAPVTFARIADAREPHNWLTYSGAYDSHRHSTLEQINASNAHRLQVKWLLQLQTNQMVEATPIVNSDVMYITEAPNGVVALDPASGLVRWRYQHPTPDDVAVCCGLVNRGVAVLDNQVFIGTIDAQLVALDARTGRRNWSSEIADYRGGISVTSAPLAIDGKIIIGVAGGEFGIRGFLDAFDAKTGRRVWRFYTIPGEGEPGHETWGAGDSWRTGGAPTWLTGSFDPELNLLYWGVGNPGPLFQTEVRPGDNLYSNSVVALNADTGKLVWHFQFTPNDEHDFDANQVPILVDREWNGVPRKLLLTANRNGFFYVLDRTNGEFLLGKPFARQNWALRLDERGRPELDPQTRVSTRGTVSWPSTIGATNWQSPAFSPLGGLFFVPFLEYGQLVFKQPDPAEYSPGDFYFGSGAQNLERGQLFYTGVRAIEPSTGAIVWETPNPRRNDWWKVGGLVSTAGKILFGGDDTRLFVLDAASGRRLWNLEVGGRVNASPITYESGGRQYFAVAAGNAIVAVGLPDPD